jgi:hypothetical protein
MTALARYGALRAELDEAGDVAGGARLTECWEHAVAIWAYVDCPGCPDGGPPCGDDEDTADVALHLFGDAQHVGS